MDVWEYHRSLVSQAWSDVMTVMQWRNTSLPMFLFPWKPGKRWVYG